MIVGFDPLDSESSSSSDGIDECLKVDIGIHSESSGSTCGVEQPDDNLVTVLPLRLDGPDGKQEFKNNLRVIRSV